MAKIVSLTDAGALQALATRDFDPASPMRPGRSD